MAKKMIVKAGDDIALRFNADATWYRVVIVEGFYMGLREIKSDGTLYDNMQASDISLVKQHHPAK